jgi:hypothetical protein
VLLPGQQPQDRQDLVTRVFKIKLKELINNIHNMHILGCMIVVEFQKHGLLHAHILIFFAEDFKPHTVEDVNRMISAKFPNPKTNRLAHETVARCMVHVELHFQMPNAWKMANAKSNIHASSNPKR